MKNSTHSDPSDPALSARRQGTLDIVSRAAMNVMLILAFGAVVTMAVVSRIDSHPDEGFHVLSASYYKDHWLPPDAGNPDMANYLHGHYGVSHLLVFPPQITYLVASKLVSPIANIFRSFAHGLRLFQVVLFLILVLAVALRPRLDPAYSFFLLLTPQLWYVFSYFNSDAFAFFVTFLVALLLGYPDSIVMRFFKGDETWPHKG